MPSLSSQTYAYKMQDNYLHDNMQGMLDVYDEFQRSHCYEPHNFLVNSSHTGLQMRINVDCGKCYHCRETKINSWVSRMYAHSEDFPYVYFVTLTYRPFYSLGSVSSLVFKKLSGALWHFDNFNENHRYGWNPCVLQKRHYQLFLKRLRKFTGASITYVVCGEYGHKYGRPHFHIILFSKSPITESDVSRSWSIGLWKDNSGQWSYLKNQKYGGKSYYFQIGRVQFDDLVSNGSFNQKDVFVDGQNLNARNCFAYVCKYVCKGGEFNKKRLLLAYNSLFEIKLVIRDFYKDYLYEDFKLSSDERKKRFIYKKMRYHNINSNHFKVTYYETIQKSCKHLYLQDVQVDQFPQDCRDFVAKFGQFFEVSRGCPIGSIYAKTHVDEFVKGVFAKPMLQDKGFVIPSYFRQKAESKVYGLRKCSRTISSKSFVFTNLQTLLEHFKAVYQGEASFRYISPIDIFNSRDIKFALTDNYFKDLWTGETILFPRYKGYVQAEYYRYSRKLKKYELLRITSLNEFLRTYIPKIEESIKRCDERIVQAQENERLQKRAEIFLDEYGFSLKNLRSRFAKKQDDYIKFRDNTYHNTHKSVE